MDETVPLAIKFRLKGDLRFLSHAETLRVFQRACIRAEIPVHYSQGFNPRPKMSLPLPRPVGVESDDELLFIRVCKGTEAREHKSANNAHEPGHEDLCALVKDRLSAQLPAGCELTSVSVAGTGTSLQPHAADYVLAVRPEYLNEDLQARIERLLSSESLNVRRQTGKRNSKAKNLDVRAFLKSIKMDNADIIVQCNISPAGSIRIEEILRLLELDEGKLMLPVRRTNVQWEVKHT